MSEEKIVKSVCPPKRKLILEPPPTATQDLVLEEISWGVEDEDIHFKLSTVYGGVRRVVDITRGELSGSETASKAKLANVGIRFSPGRKGYEELVNRIYELEEKYLETGNLPTLTYRALGWAYVPDIDPETGQEREALCYRCDRLVGAHRKAQYIGNCDVTSGNYEKWRAMVIKDIIPIPALQLVLIAALSAVIVGLLGLEGIAKCPIIHLDLPSSKGKSSSLRAATSTIGSPFDGTKRRKTANNRREARRSLYTNWSSTDVCLIQQQVANYGAVSVLNELGGSMSKNLSGIVLSLSEGVDRGRSDSALRVRVSEGYATCFISCGESSLLQACKTKQSGLAVRVLEITDELTKDAAHAKRIQDVCDENYGFAAPMLAEYILEHGGLESVQKRYSYWCERLKKCFPRTANVDRFIEKFPAFFLTTAGLAKEALGIPFDCAGLVNYLVDRDKKCGNERNTAFTSYEQILEYCQKYSHRFVHRKKHDRGATIISVPTGARDGRITEMTIPMPDGRVQVCEYELLPGTVDSILRSKGHTDLSNCIASWKQAGVLDYEDSTHPKRRRKVFSDKPKLPVYVFRQFVEGEEAKEILDELAKKNAPKIQICKKPATKVKDLLADDDEKGGACDA